MPRKGKRKGFRGFEVLKSQVLYRPERRERGRRIRPRRGRLSVNASFSPRFRRDRAHSKFDDPLPQRVPNGMAAG
jgi:hypothetical protein